MTRHFKKIIPLIIIFSVVFGLAGNIFTPHKAMALTFGEMVGKAAGRMTSCYVASWLQLKTANLASEAWALAKSRIKTSLGSGVGEIPPDETKATEIALAVPVLDLATYSLNKEKLQSQESATGQSMTNTAWQRSQNCIRDSVAKIILDWIVDQTVEWIQGGGEPKFVTNWGTFASDAFNAGVGEVINDSNFAFLCSPFRLQVNLSLTQQTFPQRIECTLDQIVENIDDFYNDFSKGGWLAYNEMWQPQNNYYGQLFMFHDEALMKGAAAKEAALNEAQAGQGFTSDKECLGIVFDQEKEQGPPPPGWVRYDKNKYCEPQYIRVITPANTVAALMAKAVTSDSDWAANIHDWMAALINAVVNRIVKEGVAYMKKSTDSSAPAGGDFDPTNEGKDINIDYSAIDTSVESTQQQISHIAGNYQKILDDRNAVLASKRQSLSYVSDTIKAYNDTRTKGCFVKQSDIDAANSAQTKLSGEISSLQSVIAETQSNLAEAQALTDEASNEQRQAVISKYSDFLNKYPSVLSDAYSGSAKKAAEDEANTWKAALDKAQQTLDSCQGSQNAG